MYAGGESCALGRMAAGRELPFQTNAAGEVGSGSVESSGRLFYTHGDGLDSMPPDELPGGRGGSDAPGQEGR